MHGDIDEKATTQAGMVSHRPLILKLLLGLAASIVFCILLVPMYNIFCQVTGFNGQTDNDRFGSGGLGLGRSAPPKVLKTDTSRRLSVEFLSQVMPGTPVDVRPLTRQVNVHPGSLQAIKYIVRNTSDKPLVLQAVPSVSPPQAAKNFHKIECFCFKQQRLIPGESREMPLLFALKTEISEDISDVSLSYAFFRVPDNLVSTTNDKQENKL